MFLVASLLVGSLCADDELEKRATWQIPSFGTVKQQVSEWMDQQQVDELTQAKVDAIWAEESAEGFGGEILDRLATTLAVLDPAAAELVEICRTRVPPLPLPDLAALNAESSHAFPRNNLRLYVGRWLAQYELYDESLALIADLQPADVVDPASLLFYQSVAYHRFLDKDKCLPALSKLLENQGQLPQRYETMAVLMRADLKPLKTDSLDEISRMMDDIERRLGLGRAGTRVRKQEDDVIAKLDKMIEELEKQQQQQQQQSSGSAGGSNPSQPMQDSVPGGGSGPGEIDPRRTGSRAGWGNLPPKQREEALQQISKGLPSHYREVIEEYFRKLARDGNN